jgi:hypothetical protein
VKKPFVVSALILLAWPAPAPAYIDGGGWQVTLPEILSEFRTVTLVEVDRVNLARGAFRFKIGKPLKGVPDPKELKLQMEWGEAGAPFKEIKPGRVAVHFTQSCDRKAVKTTSSAEFENLIAQRACLTFLDGAWFLTTPGTDGWQNGSLRRDFELVFTGTTEELADAVTKLLRGHDVLARCRRLRNTAEIQWVRYSLNAPNNKALARDPAAPAAASRPLSAWTAELKDKSGLVRAQAALALAELGAAAREAEAALTAALRDPTPTSDTPRSSRSGARRRLGAVTAGAGAGSTDWFGGLTAAQALQNSPGVGVPASPTRP